MNRIVLTLFLSQNIALKITMIIFFWHRPHSYLTHFKRDEENQSNKIIKDSSNASAWQLTLRVFWWYQALKVPRTRAEARLSWEKSNYRTVGKSLKQKRSTFSIYFSSNWWFLKLKSAPEIPTHISKIGISVVRWSTWGLRTRCLSATNSLLKYSLHFRLLF